MATFEEANHCPKCETPGDERQTTQLGKGHGVMHYIWCVNPQCEWFDTPWMVQTLPDGSVPERKFDPTIPTDLSRFKPSKEMNDMGRRYMEDILRRDLRGTDLDKGR